MIWYFVKFFREESHADQFMAGSLYLNTLGYFKQVEAEDTDGRMDSTEAIAMWLQPQDLVMTFKVPGIGEIEISKADLAGPVSVSFDDHNHLHLFCLYAGHITGFEFVDGKIECSPEDAEEIQRQLDIDERCLNFGRFAVVVPAFPFLNQAREALISQRYQGWGRLVEYYDETTFHGEIPLKDIPFRKQKRFEYQREFRICILPHIKKNDAITINIGDLSTIATKVESSNLKSLLNPKIELAPVDG
ncbi:hypothetical protein [Azospirillum sp. B4]|uniref:hypothetical protein n=1 Tax=Azospirillum sp. B4 TaxID=95605 RepID=UPI0005CA904C|nr:hypothetical protein [Azospirillum sp. B4]